MVPSVLASSVCWSLQCLFSTLTQGGWWWTLFFFQAHSFSHAVGMKGCCKQITLACVHSVSAPLGLSPLTAHTTQALGCSAGNRLRLALGCMHLPCLSHSNSGTHVVLRGADLVGPAFCALPRSKELRTLASVVAATYHFSSPCCSFFWVYNWLPFLGRW